MFHNSNPTEMIHPQYRLGIDGLRAIAVIGVLLFHFDLLNITGGFTGVDVFFVISGFLITKNITIDIQRGSFSFINFYIRRLRRLFPALFFIWLITIVFGFLLFTPEHYLRLSKSLISSVLSVSNIFFWQEAGYFDTSSSFKPLLHTWSLSVEEQFYLVWPISLLYLSRLKNSKGTIIFLIISGVVSLVFSQRWLAVNPAASFFLTPFRIFEFSIGALLVWMVESKPKNKILLESFLVVGLSLIVYSFVNFSQQTAFPGIHALVPCLGAALVIYSGENTYSGWVLRNPLSVWIGLISYSLYLIHWPLLIFYKYWKYKEVVLSEKLTLFVLSFMLAYLSYRYIEQPFRKKGFLKTYSYQKIFAAVCVSCSLALIISASLIIKEQGIPQRINEKFTDINNTELFHKEQYGGNGFEYLGTIGEERQNKLDFDVLLIGDSFARHYAAGLDFLFKNSGIMALNVTDYACIIGPDITTYVKGKADEFCIEVNQKVRELLKDNDKPVILSLAWMWYDIGICDLEGNQKKFKNMNEYYVFMVENINKIRSMIGDKRKLIIIGNPPGSGNQNGVITCLERPNFLPNNCLESMTYKREKGVGFEINLRLRALADKQENTFFLDPFDAFCDQSGCHAINANGKKIWYSDGGHLSVDGSVQAIEYFSDDIIRIIKGTLQNELNNEPAR